MREPFPGSKSDANILHNLQKHPFLLQNTQAIGTLTAFGIEMSNFFSQGGTYNLHLGSINSFS